MVTHAWWHRDRYISVLAGRFWFWSSRTNESSFLKLPSCLCLVFVWFSIFSVAIFVDFVGALLHAWLLQSRANSVNSWSRAGFIALPGSYLKINTSLVHIYIYVILYEKFRKETLYSWITMTNIPLRLNLNSKMLGSETKDKRSLVRALVTLRESFIAFCDTTQTNTQLEQWWPQLMSLRLNMSPSACCRRKHTHATFLAHDSAQVAWHVLSQKHEYRSDS